MQAILLAGAAVTGTHEYHARVLASITEPASCRGSAALNAAEYHDGVRADIDKANLTHVDEVLLLPFFYAMIPRVQARSPDPGITLASDLPGFVRCATRLGWRKRKSFLHCLRSAVQVCARVVLPAIDSRERRFLEKTGWLGVSHTGIADVTVWSDFKFHDDVTRQTAGVGRVTWFDTYYRASPCFIRGLCLRHTSLGQGNLIARSLKQVILTNLAALHEDRRVGGSTQPVLAILTFDDNGDKRLTIDVVIDAGACFLVTGDVHPVPFHSHLSVAAAGNFGAITAPFGRYRQG